MNYQSAMIKPKNKWRLILALTIIIILIFGLSASATASNKDIQIFVNGNQISFDSAPVIINDTTLVPMRAIFESIGAEVTWDGKTKTASGSKDGNTVSVRIGNAYGYKNGVAIKLLQPARIINDRTMIPLRFVSESLDYDVQWYGSTRTITINNKSFIDQPDTATGPYTVLRVVDGDTIEINYNGAKEKVRLIGVDTPESVHPNQDKNTDFGKVASAYTKNMLENQDIYLELDVATRDKYGRILAYVYLDGVMYNKTLLRSGMAVVATFPPNIKYVDDFLSIQEQARKTQIGVWKGYQEQATKPSAGQDNFTGKYYVTKSGSKYHYLNPCGSGTYYEASWQEIQNRGLEPCEKCVH